MQNSKITSLESLRGIAAMIVFLGHFIYLFCSKEQINLLKSVSFLFNGTSSVYLFFILSGFVLSYKFWITYSPSQLLASAIKRYFRLLFIVFLSGMFAYCLSYFDLLYNPFDFSQRSFSPIQVSLTEIIYQNFMVFFTGKHTDEVFWTMRLEYLGSLFIFFYIFITQFIPRKVFLTSVIAFIFLSASIEIIYPIHQQLGIKLLAFFATGMLLSFCYVNYSKKTTKPFLYNLFSPLLYCVAFCIFFFQAPILDTTDLSLSEKFQSSFNFFIYVLLGSVLIYGAIKIKVIKNFLESKPLVFLGKISFPFYAIHSLIFGSLNVWILQYISDKEGIFAILLLLFTDLFVCIILSYYLEKLDKKWIGWINLIYNHIILKKGSL